MITNNKRIVKLCAIFMFAAILVSVLGLACIGTTAWAADSRNEGRTYYYDELKNSSLAQSFYGVFEEMAADGSLLGGKAEYDLVAKGILSNSDVSDYITNESTRIPVALGAARDAFFMDHPELFYADVHKMRLNVGMQGETCVAYLGAGTEDNYYADNTVSSESEAKTAVGKYNAALKKVVEAVKAVGSDTVSRIKAANEYLAENTEYGYGDNDGYVYTSYGSLVNGLAVCEGYSFAFKAVMDELDIPCVLICGSAVPTATPTNPEPVPEPHMWNGVEVEGKWYAVDVTWNSTCNNNTRYLLVGDDYISQTHFADGVISSTGFELKYPSLRPLNYGVNEDASGFEFKDDGNIGSIPFGYEEYDGRWRLTLGVSYEDKNAYALAEEGKYLAFSYNGNGIWFGMVEYYKTLLDNLTGFEAILETKYSACFNLDESVEKIQFAIIDYAPDNGMSYYVENLDVSAFRALSSVYTNKAFGSFYPAPWVIDRTPDENGYLKSFDSLDVTLKYDDDLVKADGSDYTPDYNIEISITGSMHGDMSKYVKVTDVKYDVDTRVISFTFTPSPQYSHNCETYTFVPTNMIGKTSGKVPQEGGYFSFKREQVVCPRVFNDGRLYMLVYGEPVFVGAEDMSLDEFKDGDGKPVVNQRSQLMLVVDEPSKTQSDTMEQALLNQQGLNKENVTSSTYQIDLQMCGMVQKVPTGSYMQVGFGFPDGYGPESVGVTFTVYHYTLNSDGTIDKVEPVPCVITEYGIIAKVVSFSPFAVCAVKNSAPSATKNIYAYVEGTGGTIDKTVVQSVAANESVTYTLTPYESYKNGEIVLTLNGQDVSDKVENGKVTLSYDDISANSVLKVTFVSERTAKFCSENGIKLAQPQVIAKQSDLIVAVAHVEKNTLAEGRYTVLIVVAVIVLVAVAAAVVWAIVYMRSNKKNGGTPQGGKKEEEQNKKTQTVRPATATAGATARPSASAQSVRPSATVRQASSVQRPAPAARPSATTPRTPEKKR